MTEYETVTQAEPSGPARYEQRVDLTVMVTLTGLHEDFEQTTHDRVRLAIEQAIKAYLPPILLDATIDISAQRGPGGSRYVYPGDPAPARETDITLDLRKTVPFMGDQ